jgi:hypothetical protein
VIRSLRHILAALLIVGASSSTAVGVASAATKDRTPCWKTLINDWYDGRIDGIYPIHCYRDALKHLPADVDTYSSARDDIQQALQKRITESRTGHTSTTGTTTTTPGGAGGSGGNGDGSGGGSSSGGSGGGTTQGSGGSKSASGPINDAINAGKPGSADSLPVPLLVLGGVALVLMAAGGAGFLARRSRLRRMQVASAASVPNGPGTERPEQP